MGKTKKKTSKKSVFKDIRTYLMTIFTVAILYFIYQVWDLNTIPMKFFLPVVIVLLLFMGLLFLSQYSKRVSKLNKTLCKIIIILLSVLMIVGNVYVYQARHMLNKVSVNAGDVEYDVMSVVVKKDNSAEKLADVKNSTFAISKMDNILTTKTLKEIKSEVKKSVKTKECANVNDQAAALYDGSVETMIMNEAYRSLLDENYPAFATETKVIYQYKIPKKVKKMGRAVDVNKEPYNVYISGIDVYGDIATKSRSDVNMIATINPNTKQILLTSIPRDYYVAQTCQANQKDKLTHSGIFGIDCTIESMENFTGLTMNYYIRVNFSSLEGIVNALGGIDIYNPIAFNSGVDSSYIPAGQLHMDGATALKFSRERHAYADGDRQRGRNQMMVIEAIVNKATSPAILSGYSSVLDTVGDTVQTNMKSNDMTSIIKKQLSDSSGWEVVQQSVTGSGGTDWTPANGFNAYVMYPDQESVDKAIANINQVLEGKKVSIEE